MLTNTRLRSDNLSFEGRTVIGHRTSTTMTRGLWHVLRFRRRGKGGSRRGAAGRGRGWLVWVGCWVLTVVGAAGCASSRAATVPNGPPLAMPDPPPRVFLPAEEEPLAATPVILEVPAAEPQQAPPRPPARRAAAAPPAPEKTEPAPPPPAPAPNPPRELRAASTPADAEADRKIRTLLVLATGLLGKVDYRQLSAAGREQYDQAKNFGVQAEEALAQRNYVFAETLADKAAKLASELPQAR